MKEIIEGFKGYLQSDGGSAYSCLESVEDIRHVGCFAHARRYFAKIIKNNPSENGRLNIDNNPVEQAIRPFVVGRKNWLFSDTPEGAHANANLYTLIETAKANSKEPYDYLCKLFEKLPSAKSPEDYESLLPWNF